jgi:hypothetical protein
MTRGPGTVRCRTLRYSTCMAAGSSFMYSRPCRVGHVVAMEQSVKRSWRPGGGIGVGPVEAVGPYPPPLGGAGPSPAAK